MIGSTGTAIKNCGDSEAFVGLPSGEIGEHGALVRSESLVLTEEILKQAYASGDPDSDHPEIPPYLNPDGPPRWTPEYPQEFREHIEALPQLAGFTFHAGDAVHERGYFASSARNAFDFQLSDSPRPRGLLRITLDPLSDDEASRGTTIDYDAFDLLPVRITDAVGLVTEASYDPRVLQPDKVTDPNGNRTRYTYTPLGLLKDIAMLGKEGEFAGDEESLPGDKTRVVPSARFDYDLLAFVNSRAEERVPISVHTIRRVHHIGETDVPDEEERNKTVETMEYSDGFGRLLQTRTLAEDDTVGHPIFGGMVLSADQAVDPGEVVLRARALDGQPNVVVSGAQVYDNKGRVVEKFEPYFELDAGLAYRPPGEEQRGQRVSMFYDPLGRMIRTCNPDGSEQRVIYGVPGSIRTPDLTTPDVFEPTPWEAYTYDANDLAPVSREPQADGSPGPLLTQRAPRHHHFTPSSIFVDALGRTILAVARNREDPANPDAPPVLIETRSEYDIRGNVLKVIDARQREAFTYVYDMADHALRTENIDAGVRRVVLDAAGNEVERRDSKGAVILQAYDRLERPTRLWARDDDDKKSDVTLRERLEYGDGGDPDQDEELREENRALNRLGALHRHYDEAGLLELAAYDFKGNVLEKSRRVIRDKAILAVFPNPRNPDADWNIRAFRVNWHPLEQEQDLLAEQRFETSMAFDALNRVKKLLYPRDVEGGRKELRPTYNRAGALESLTLDGEPFVEHIAYDAKGQRTFVALGNRVMTLYAYEPRTFRLGRMFSTRFSTNGGRTFQPLPLTSPEARRENLHQDFGYDYDLVGNITRIRDRTPESGILNTVLGHNSLDRVFEYEAIYRLTFAAGRETDRSSEQRLDEPFDPRPRDTDITKARAYHQRYRYDVLGNLEELTHSTFNGRPNTGAFVRRFEHRSGTNQMATMSVGASTLKYAYDKNGNLTDENTSRHFEWDHSDRMKVFRNQVRAADAEDESDLAEPTVFAHYLYDAGGQRVKKLVRKQKGGFETTVYIDSGFEHHRWQRNGEESEANNRLHVMDDQQRIAMVRVGDPHPDDKGPNVQYQFGDHLASSNVVVSENGSFVNHEEFTPYGETSFGSFARKRYRFTGKERDEESGLYYHGVRYYAPSLARWISCDPAGNVDGLNLYTYGRNNPSGFADSTGMQSEDRPSEGSKGKVTLPTHASDSYDLETNTVTYTFGWDAGEGALQDEPTNGEGKSQAEHKSGSGADGDPSGSKHGRDSTAWDFTVALAAILNDPAALAKSTGTGGRNGIPGAQGSWDSKVGQALFVGLSAVTLGLGKFVGKVVGKVASAAKGIFRWLGNKADKALGWARHRVASIRGRFSQAGWRYIKPGTLSLTERALVNEVANAPKVLVGRGINIEGQGFFTLDNWMLVRDVQWNQRLQDVYNYALYSRTRAGKPAHVIAGRKYTAGEAAAAEAGAAKSGVTNIPFWPQ